MSHEAYYSTCAIDVSRESFHITSLQACGRRIILGCSDGLIRVFEDRAQPNDKADYKPTFSSESFTRKSVDQLEVFPLEGIMLSLSDQILRLHSFPSLEVRQEFDTKSRGCLSFVTNHTTSKKGPTSSFMLCLSLKRRIHVYEWSDSQFAFGFRKEINLPETPRKMGWASGMSIACSFYREYKILDCKTEKLTTIFPFGKRHAVICRMESTNEVLLTKNNHGICVDQYGKPTRTEPIEWSEPPNFVLYCRPYVIAATSKAVDVRFVSNRLPVQVINFNKATMVATTFLGEKMVVAANAEQVLQMTPVSPNDQLEELVAKCNFETALLLIEEDLNDVKWRENRATLRRKVRTQYGYHLYNQREFETALQLFQATETNPRQVLALFPQMLPKGQCKNVTHPVDHIVGIEKREDLFKAVGALIAYLEHLRNRFKINPSYFKSTSTSSATAHTNTGRLSSSSSQQEMPLNTLVDTALVFVFLEIDNPNQPSRALLTFLSQETACDLAVTEEILTTRGRFRELVAFYKTREMHESALKLLKKVGHDDKKNKKKHKKKQPKETAQLSLHGPNPTIEYLIELAPYREYQDLVITYAEWVVKEYPLEGLRIFTGDPRENGGDGDGDHGVDDGGDAKNGTTTKEHKRSTIPARLVLKLLKSWCGPSIVVMYLEKYLKNTNNTMAALHNELVFLYLDLIQKARISGLGGNKAGPSSSSSSSSSSLSSSSSSSSLMDRKMLRSKLHAFLSMSKHYKPELMLGRFPENELLEERAVVLSRLKDHREALAIYVWDLNDLEKAHRYCMEHYDYHRAHDKDVFLHLLHVLLRPECVETGRLKKADAAPPKPKLEEAMKILMLDHKRINVPKAMDLLPDDLSITKVFPILKAVLSHNKARSRRNQVTKSLHRIDNLTVRSEWIRTRSQQVRIDNITKCHHCSRRIGNAAFIRYPGLKNKRPVVVHYVCSESFQASQSPGGVGASSR